MLDAFIIEEIKRREEQHRRDAERPRVERPAPTPTPPSRQTEDDKPKRGVVIIENVS